MSGALLEIEAVIDLICPRHGPPVIRLCPDPTKLTQDLAIDNKIIVKRAIFCA
jgi:hypothetical protein